MVLWMDPHVWMRSRSRPAKQIAQNAQMRANAPNQIIAAKAAAESLLSPGDLKKECNKQNNKNLRKRHKQIANAEQQIEDC